MSKEVVRVVAAVIEREGRYLLTQRQESAVLPLLWEFPGGRVEPGESDSKALVREVEGRIGLIVSVFEQIGEHIHEYDAYEVHISLYACALPVGSTPTAVGVQQVRWVRSSEFESYEFPPADQQSMARLLNIGH
jgi:8-oxo-dGTP diphosphatase